MNTNCSKCGNPLQAGTTICPVCGTNNINANVAPAAPAQAAPAPVPQVPVDAALTAAPVQPAGTPAPAAAEPAPVAPATGVAPAPAQAPATEAVPAAQPTGAVPVVAPSATAPATPPKEKPKGNSKTIIIIIVVGLVLIGGVVGVLFFINSNNSTPPAVDNPSNVNGNNNQGTVAQNNNVSIEDFEYNLPAGWRVVESEDFVRLVKSDDLEIEFAYLMQDFTNQDILDLFTTIGITDAQINQATVSGKNAYTADFVNEEKNIRMYFVTVDGGTIMAAVQVYTDAVKGEVERIIGSIKYNESGKAIDIFDSFHEVVMKVYDKIDEINNSGEEDDGNYEDPREDEKDDQNGGSQGGF